ncbi:MAG: hypothetical protein JOZ54_01975, partial [Acidobacteria bacterium]|nr:hypothetical protein [Acidobacteriota bacterium]
MRHVITLLSSLALAVAAEGAHIRDVQVSPPFFNPTAGRSAQIHARVDAGTVTLTILDRDRVAIRKLPPQTVASGDVAFAWDGRDDRGEVVPDEAYNVRVEWRDKAASDVYDPSLDFHPTEEEPQTRSYSRLGGVLSYRLSRPSRVHIEAGQATPNRKTGKSEGPILRTIVNREPRVGGAVVEKWNGFDESGSIRIADLPHFAISILATSLPDNSIIACGNKRETFVAYASRRPAPSPVIAIVGAMHGHHAGLSALDDGGPALHIEQAHRHGGGMDVVV